MTGTCICGAVSVTIETAPDFIHDCNCSLCRKSGGAWGYFSSAQFHQEGETVSVTRSDKELASAEIHSCPICCATTHFTMSEEFTEKHGPTDMVGVNMRLFDLEALDGVEVRFPDGNGWSGEGEFEYRREAETIGKDFAW
ncbi:MAG: aldehyde-activating protein [Pseudomonadota bacterium]